MPPAMGTTGRQQRTAQVLEFSAFRREPWVEPSPGLSLTQSHYYRHPLYAVVF